MFCGEATFTTRFYGEAVFDHATFCEVSKFRDAEFLCAVAFFIGTDFCKETSFSNTKFTESVNFSRATFCEDVSFDGTEFHGDVDFQQVTFAGQTAFNGTAQNRMFCNGKRVNFRNAEIEDSSRTSFHTITLRPGWFVDVDSRQFSFTDVDWYRLHSWRRRWTIGDELKAVRQLGVTSAAVLLEVACRELAINSEEHHRYVEASRFRFLAMDARRRQSKRGSLGLSLDFWYWVLSGYGELQGRALFWLGVILLGFAGLYMWADFPQELDLTWSNFLPSLWQSTIYSLGVMTRQRLTIEPEPGLVQVLVVLEGVFGPLQIAVFALALRRKFMK